MRAPGTPLALKAALCKGHPPGPLTLCTFTILITPALIGLVEVAGFRAVVIPYHAALSNELPQNIHILAIASGRLLHLLRLSQAALLPGKTATYRPGENLRQFVFEPVWKVKL